MPKYAKQKRPLSATATAIASAKPPVDAIIRDDFVPELARRVRGATATWVVYWRKDGRSKKTTLGDCTTIAVDRARDLARDMVRVGRPKPVTPSSQAAST